MTPHEYIEQALQGFKDDPADSDFQRGYLAGLQEFMRTGLEYGWFPETGDEYSRGFADGRKALFEEIRQYANKQKEQG